MPNPWILIFLILGTLALGGGAYERGKHVGKDTCEAAHNKEAIKAKDTADKTEKETDSDFEKLEAELAKEKANVKELEDKLRAAIVSGTHILRIQAKCKRLPSDPSDSDGGAETSVELAGTARQAYFNLRSALMDDHDTLGICQGTLRVIEKKFGSGKQE